MRNENVAINIVIGSQAEMIDLLKAARIEMVLGRWSPTRTAPADPVNQSITKRPNSTCRPGNPLAQSEPWTEDLAPPNGSWEGGYTLRARIDEAFRKI